jgi:bifunctional UDP-N-acetylglucosamine pyrophosphorylase/glucosamine-1-phosphate N-acetyltransferase
MHSRTPKVLHTLAGRPLIDFVIDAVQQAGLRRIVVVLSPAQPEVAEHIHGRCEVVYQEAQRGTGHALAQAPDDVLGHGDVLVVNGDQPLLRSQTMERLVAAHRAARAAATLATVVDPLRSDGRVMRAPDGRFERIVEAIDASPVPAGTDEINVGLYCFRGGSELLRLLASLKPSNRAHELYLTDLFNELRPVEVVRLDDPLEAIGINDRVHLARAEAALRARILEDLMRAGVTIVDPASTYVDSGVAIGEDTVLEPMTIVRGSSTIGRDCTIGPYAEIYDSTVGDGCRIQRSWIRESSIADGSDCGPFSKLRPGTEIGVRVHVGSFVEIVRSRIGPGSAVPHVSYLGDAEVGENVNIGAGTITANYDGEKKNRTEIGDGAFIGVDTMLRAPVKVGRRSRTGAGSVVTKDVPDGATAVGVPARVVRRESHAGHSGDRRR